MKLSFFQTVSAVFLGLILWNGFQRYHDYQMQEYFRERFFGVSSSPSSFDLSSIEGPQVVFVVLCLLGLVAFIGSIISRHCQKKT